MEFVFYSFTLRHYSSSFLFSYKFSFLQAHIFIIFWLYGSTARFCFSTFLYQTLLVRLHRFRWGPFDECLKAEDRQKRIFSFLYQEKFLKIFQTFQIWKLYLFDLFQREVLHPSAQVDDQVDDQGMLCCWLMLRDFLACCLIWACPDKLDDCHERSTQSSRWHDELIIDPVAPMVSRLSASNSRFCQFIYMTTFSIKIHLLPSSIMKREP